MLALKRGGHCAMGVQVEEWLLPSLGRRDVAFQLGLKGCFSYKQREMEGKNTLGRGSSQSKDRGRT